MCGKEHFSSQFARWPLPNHNIADITAWFIVWLDGSLRFWLCWRLCNCSSLYCKGGVQGKWMQIVSACCQQRHQVRLLQLPPPPRLSKNQGPALHTQYPQSKSKKSHKPKDIEPKEMIHKTSPEKSFQFNRSLNLSTAPLRRPLGKQPATGDWPSVPCPDGRTPGTTDGMTKRESTSTRTWRIAG